MQTDERLYTMKDVVARFGCRSSMKASEMILFGPSFGGRVIFSFVAFSHLGVKFKSDQAMPGKSCRNINRTSFLVRPRYCMSI